MRRILWFGKTDSLKILFKMEIDKTSGLEMEENISLKALEIVLYVLRLETHCVSQKTHLKEMCDF